MITSRTQTKEWIMSIREKSPGRDPILVEKMIMALILLENLRLSGLDFIFKGGTSLILLLDTPRRFSIDIDIVLPDDNHLESCFQAVIERGSFHRYEENRRAGDLPKAHYKFFFDSIIQNKESHILLDILFEHNPYPVLQNVALISPLLNTDGAPTQVVCPTVECLLGDKLTAFAPHTTGIQYGMGKELEIAKQLFDIGILFEAVENVELVGAAFETIAAQELAYRAMSRQTIQDVLRDAIETAFVIGMRGVVSANEYAEMLEGFKKLAAFIYSGNFSLDRAILCASKVALLAAAILQKEHTISRFPGPAVIAEWKIGNPNYNKLNKLKKTDPEAFFYFHLALQKLGLDIQS